jgi:hypothetical protein
VSAAPSGEDQVCFSGLDLSHGVERIEPRAAERMSGRMAYDDAIRVDELHAEDAVPE